ncbi:MAG: chemotaxis response regulator protein-glutamate methylesterase [Oligoflexales bacterium]|nr:chemotaxis response regulator protein-glutamate methylesterase [Oligoflexales bacterium]
MSVNKIKVLVVDDSSVVRTLLTRILHSAGDIEVVATAPDPYVARQKLVMLKPDVITLDIEMPRLDGVTFLEKVMEYFPTPTVIISSLSQKGSETAFRALEAGAVAVIAKPALDVSESLQKIGAEVIEHVRAASKANVRGFQRVKRTAVEKSSGNRALSKTTHQLLAIGASTGGTEALKVLLPSLPADLPGTVIVQHMPPVFTKAFAQKLNEICPFDVKEAASGDYVRPGIALIAPGDFHVTLQRDGAYYVVGLNKNPPVHQVRPSADILFESVAEWAGANAIGVILTGMGRDGAKGLKKMHEAGSYNIAQNEESCIVFGMPREAIALGAVDRVLPLKDIAGALVTQFNLRRVV